MTIIDSHCHLDFPAFDDDLDEVVRRANATGVHGFVVIGIDPGSWRSTEELVDRYQGFWRAAGIHPNSIGEQWDAATHDALASEVAGGGVVAIGETGIDLYRSSDSRERQIEAFEAHIALARRHDLPVIIHQRAAETDVLDVLSSAGGVPGVLHCFGGDWQFAKACLDLGLMLGIGGVATYPRSDDVRDAIRRMPADRILLETDAPFLAPQSRRGKRNEPALLVDVVETIAGCRGTTTETVERETTDNAMRLFDLDLSSVGTGA